MSSRTLRRIVLVATLTTATACGSSAPDHAMLDRACGEARNACVGTCGGGDYVPEPCRAACEAGRDACRGSAADHCGTFRAGCAAGCQTPRCTGACDVGSAKCPPA